MCGFVGVSSVFSLKERKWLGRGSELIAHRGPDHKGEWWSNDGRVGLAHQRLSILDLSAAGNQPMSDVSGELQLVFNGEIYNYLDLRKQLIDKGMKFRSETDTEVILAAYQMWGVGCIDKLSGMFAFGLYDSKEQLLFIARDRVGEKPLFYHYEDNIFRFASELKALLVDPQLKAKISFEELDCYLAYGYVPRHRCILQGFNKLPAAHAATYNLKSGIVNVWKYWNLPEFEIQRSNESLDEIALQDELEHLLEDSVRRQLVADVPVGVLLSGGVDSSLVTAMAARTSGQVKTFTVRMSGYAKLDEAKHARLIANHFKTEHIELEAQSSSIEFLPDLIRQFDEPMVDSSMIPTFLVSQLVRQHCKVVLGGDGGDELFGGYHHYSRLLALVRILKRVPPIFRGKISWLIEQILPVGFKGRNWLQALNWNFNTGVPILPPLFDKGTRRALMNHAPQWDTLAESILSQEIKTDKDVIQRATRHDFMHYLAEDILVKVDRTSMLNSLEIRSPFLDHRIIEFAFRKVPSSLKVASSGRKILLKQLARQVLPEQFDIKRKQGFSIPLNEWLKKGPFRDLFNDVLFDSSSVFDHQVIKQLLKGQALGCNNGERLFSLVIFNLWCKEYAVNL